MSEEEISISDKGITLKGKVVEDVRKPIKRLASTADSFLRLIDNVVGLPCDYISYHLETFRIKYTEGYEEIPKERRREPSFRLGCTILKHVAYAADEPEIQILFAKLLISSSDSNYADQVHPGYASIINEMTTLDAKVLNNFNRGAASDYSNEEQTHIPQAYSNLIRLGLIEVHEREHTKNELEKFVGKIHHRAPSRSKDINQVVVDLINDIENLKNTIIQDHLTATNRKQLKLTRFGHNFLAVVERK